MDNAPSNSFVSSDLSSDARNEFAPYVLAIQRGRLLAEHVSPVRKSIINCFLFLFSIYFRLRMGLGQCRASAGREKADVYSRYKHLAAKYERKHTLTTNGRDTWLRREVAYHVTFLLKERRQIRPSEIPILIDLCSGTGLSLREMFRVFNLEDVAVKAIGIELNEAMLRRSQTKIVDCIRDSRWTVPGTREILFMKGDAYQLTENKEKSSDLTTFDENSISCITNVFGACGLKNPLQSFTEQLKVLESGGSIIAIDVHRPIPSMTPAWPFEKYTSWPAFEQIAWDRVTVPLVLNMFWAWEDPTITFYTVPLLTIQSDSDGKYYGFKLKYRLLRTENWWFGLPVMPIAIMILQKVEIKAAEAHERKQLLERTSKNY